ncbi:MAG: hypothetical protein NTZ78_12075 [Candidatus Aureabacteria bacterium]|nr:hypothetical protein [Candidatus Auribacterota bacterium]
MKKLMMLAAGLMFAAGMTGMAIAGSLNSPGAPSAGSGMYTLQNLYDYLTSGAALTVQTSFQEPTSGPGSTMKTTKEIGDAVATPFAMCDTTAANVESGKKFFCTQPGRWGVQTGTAIVITPTPTPTATPTITPTPTPWCAANGGFWSSDGVGGYGCWFSGEAHVSCTAICSGKSLTCRASGSWNDDSNCSACIHYHQTAPCNHEGNGPGQPYFQDTTCYYRDSGNQDCGAEVWGSGTKYRVCICD